MERSFQKKKRKRTAEGGKTDFNTVIVRSLIGLGASALSGLALSLAAAGLCMLSPDPAALTLPTGIAIFCIASVIGGAVSGMGLSHDKTAAVVSGIACGFFLVIITGVSALIQGLIVPEYTHGLGILSAVLLRSAALPLSALAAFLAVNKRKKAKRRRR